VPQAEVLTTTTTGDLVGVALRKSSPDRPGLEGNCVGLKGHVVDCTELDQADKFIKTRLDRICIYVGSEFKHT